MDSIGTILQHHVREQTPIARNVQIARILSCFDQVVKDLFGGEYIAQAVKATFFKKRVLAVSVKSSVVSQELRFVEDDIIRIINERLGRDLVGGIMYMVK